MQPLTVVLLQDNPITKCELADSLLPVGTVVAVGSLEELRHVLPTIIKATLVLDIELAPLREVSRLTQDFPAASVVCNHRTPDEQLWVQAMNAGAADCCSSSDISGIVRAVVADISLRAAA